MSPGVATAPEDAVRPATTGDLDVLEALATLAVDEQRDGRGGAVWSRREARRNPRATLADAMTRGDHHVVVGTLDDVIVGYGVVHSEPLADGGLLAVVDDLFVEPDARGVGVGEALMEALVAKARAWGAIGVDALALPGNRATKNFFESFGLTARAIVVHTTLDGGDDPAP